MTGRRADSGKRRPAWAWTLLGVVSSLLIGGCVAADQVWGDGSLLVMIVVVGLVVVAVAAGFMVSPVPRDGHGSFPSNPGGASYRGGIVSGGGAGWSGAGGGGHGGGGDGGGC